MELALGFEDSNIQIWQFHSNTSHLVAGHRGFVKRYSVVTVMSAGDNPQGFILQGF